MFMYRGFRAGWLDRRRQRASERARVLVAQVYVTIGEMASL